MLKKISLLLVFSFLLILPIATYAKDEISAEDLGVAEQTVLPGDAFYGFKNFWRGVRSAITRDPVKKAELELQFANEKIIEAQKLAQKEGNEEAINQALENYNQSLEKIQAATEKFKDRASEKVDNFITKLADTEFKRQRAIERLGDKLPEQALNKIIEARDKSAEHFSEVIERTLDKEKITEKIQAAIYNQGGDGAGELANLEILKKIKANFSDKLKNNIDEVQSNIVEKLKNKLKENGLEGEDGEAIKEHLEMGRGGDVNRLEIIEKLEEDGNIPEDVLEHLKEIREKLQNKEEMRMEELEDSDKKEMLRQRLNEVKEQREMFKARKIEAIKELEENAKEKEEEAGSEDQATSSLQAANILYQEDIEVKLEAQKLNSAKSGRILKEIKKIQAERMEQEEVIENKLEQAEEAEDEAEETEENN